MPNPEQSLDQFLTELEAEYVALGDKIAFIRERLGLEPGQGGTGPLQSSGMAFNGPRSAGTVRGDEFFGLSLPDAIRAYLAIVKKPQTAKQIEIAILGGGLITTSKNFYANIFTALKRLRKSEEVIQVPGSGYGLTEWYKGRTMTTEQGTAAKNKAKKRPKKKTKKPPTTHQRFVSEQLKQGKTMGDGAVAWRPTRLPRAHPSTPTRKTPVAGPVCH